MQPEQGTTMVTGKLCKILAALILINGLFACVASHNLTNSIDMEIDRLFSTYSGEQPGAAVMIVHNGEPVFAKGYGLAQLEPEVPVDTSSNFRLASITKQFTATAVLMFVDRGGLALDDSIRDYFPEFPAYTNDITIRHLLQHVSGLKDYEPIYGNRFPEQVTDSGVVEIVSQTERGDFTPGSQYHYSNTGYAVLAVLVERLSGQSFADFLAENIFEPVGMSNTLAFDGSHPVSNRAYGYTVKNGQVFASDQSAWSAVLGDGGVYSSLDDLLKWDQFLYENDLISPALVEATFTPGREDYGFGWRIDDYRGHRRHHHSGSTSGFRNFIQRFPDEQLTIVILTNRAAPDVAPLGDKLADLYLP